MQSTQQKTRHISYRNGGIQITVNVVFKAGPGTMVGSELDSAITSLADGVVLGLHNTQYVRAPLSKIKTTR